VTTAGSQLLNVSLVPAGMAWVDLANSSGTDVMLQLLSDAAVRAFHGGAAVGGPASSTSRLRRLNTAASGGASAAANRLTGALVSAEGAVAMRGLTLLPQVEGARWVTMTPDNLPGVDPRRLVSSTPAGPPPATTWRDDPRAVGGLAAGVTIGVLAMVVAAAVLLVVRRRRLAVKGLTGKRAPEEPQFPTPSKPEPEFFDMANPGVKTIPRPRSSRAIMAEAPPAAAAPKGSMRTMGDSLGHSSRRLPVQPVRTRKSAYLPEGVDGDEDGSATARSSSSSKLETVPEEGGGGAPRLKRQGSKFLAGNPMAASAPRGGFQAL
jgi:hypothetical protein